MNRKCYKSVISEGLGERLRLARQAFTDDFLAEKLRRVRSDLLDRLRR
jgi:hypothetical protein